MKGLNVTLIIAALVGGAMAQDWYSERETRYHGDEWRPKVFVQVRTDLEHIWSANQAADRERKRIQRTEQELTKMQVSLTEGRWDNGVLNDVIDSIRKSADDQRLSPRDREVLADDVKRLKDYQDNHNTWPH